MKTSITTIHKLLLAALMLAPLVGRAQEISASALEQIGALMAEKDSRSPAEKKMDSQLVYLSAQQQNQPVANGVQDLQVAVEVAADNRVLVDISGTVSAELTDAITLAGGEVVNQFAPFDATRARVPVAALETLAGRADVRSISPAAQAITNIGSALSEADRTHKAALARTTLGVTGNGIKIGVLSDGVNSLGLSINNGNINANAQVIAGQAGSGDEGTAMMELIQDLVPGAQLYFATAFNGNASFASNILALQAAGCSIIVDDVSYFNESPFQDQVIAQAVNTVSGLGVLYFSSAGNSGNKNDNTSGAWEGDFVSGGAVAAPVTGTGLLLDFGGSTFNTVAAGGSSRRVDLFWSDPDLGSANDYDLFVLDSTGTTVLRSSTNVQSGTQSPYEATGTLNVGERIVVVQRTGAANRFIQLTTGRARLTISTNGVIRGHNASGAANAFCVAATPVSNSPSPNTFVGGATNPVETFSSDGPRRVFFQPNGTALTPGNLSSTGGVLLNKPDITAADGTTTSLAANSGFNPFFGTSAAAPHAAAIAALLKSYNPSLTPAQIRSAMTSTALDIEAAGVDRDSGAGIVMAQPALASVAAPDPLTVTTSGDLNASGNVGGPFTPSSVTYTLTNTSGSPVNWTAAKTQSWVDLSPTSGTLAPAANVVLTCSINAVAAAALPGGAYSDAVTITNTTSGFSRKLAVNLVASVPVPPSVAYSNTTNFLGQAFSNTGATSTATGPRLVADDITFLAGTAGRVVTQITFSVSNLDVSSFSARPRLRFWAPDGAGGGPGTAIAGFTFNPITFSPGVSQFFFDPAGAIVVPAGEKIWAGMTFDGVGATATLTQINNLGQGIYNPPTVGSSADTMFISTNLGSNFVNNPPGSFSNFSGSPVANFGWQFSVSTAPVVTTAAPASLAATSATLGGNVVSDGGSAITDRGIVWGLALNPTTADTKVANGTGTGSFSATVTGLPALTTIHVRAYAINAVSTTYGADFTLTTPSANADLSNLVLTTATLDSAFAPGTIAYTSTVPNSTSSLTVTPTAAQANATITVNGNPVASASPSGSISLSVGLNTITTIVTAQDTTTTKTYTVGVTRLSPTLPTVTPSSAALAANALAFNISGTNFAALFSDNTVALSSGTAHVAGQVGQVTLNVVFDTPPSPGILTAVVTTPAGNSGAPVQVATVGPVITANTGNLPSNSTTLTINGFGFSTTPASNTVAFLPAGTGTVTASTATSLTVSSVAGLTNGALNAIVTSNGVASASAQVATVVTPAPLFVEQFETGLEPFPPTSNHASPGAALTLATGQWYALNLSSPIGTTGVFGADNSNAFGPHTTGLATYAGINYLSGSGASNLNTFLMGPVLTLNNGDTISFYTRTTDTLQFPDRLRLLLSTSGASTAAASFTTTLLSVNEGLTTSGYPNTWTLFTATISGLPGPTSGRFAFNYNVPNGGPGGANSDFIGIDIVSYTPSTPPSGPLVFTGVPIVIQGGNYQAGGNEVPTREMNFTPTPGQSYPYIEVTGAANDIIGTFNDLPDGGVVAMNFNGVIYYFQVNYNGGTDGNDLIFTSLLNPGPANWKWTAGPDARNAVAIFGAEDVGADANNPGARQGAMNWRAPNGSLWMFGGYGYASALTARPNYLNDLWEYNRTTGQWIWHSGAQVHNQFGTYGVQGTPAAANTPGSRHTGTTWTDSSGDLWLFGGLGYGASGGRGRLNDLWRFSISTGQWTWMKGSNATGAAGVYSGGAATLTPGARQGATGWTAANGSLYLFGGTTDGGSTFHNDLWLYSIGTGNWTLVKGNGTTNLNGTYGTQGTGAAANTPGARRDATGWVAKDGTLWLFGGRGLAETGATLGDMSDLWSFNTTTSNWTHVSGPKTQGGAGTYTALGSPGTPAARSAGSGWVTVDGDFWLVGGFKNSKDCYSDVWIYDIGSNTWTWQLGSSSLNVSGTYGTLGVAAPGNQPGARYTPSTWVTLNGAIWVFGGGGFDGRGNGGGRVSDLWRYGIATPAGAPPEPSAAPFPNELIVNDAPDASDAAAGTMAYVPVTGQLSGSDADGDNILFLSSSPTALSQGTLSLNPDGTWSYTPAPGFVGQSTFQFRAADAYGGSSPVRTLVITVVTNPDDSDNDGIADAYEQTYLGGTGADALGDADLDGQNNYFEYLAGTSPVDAAQSLSTAPSIAASDRTKGGSFKLDLNHVRPGVNYHLETSTDLDVWNRIGTFTFSVSGSATIEDPTPPSGQPQFYRVSLESPTLLP